MTVQDFEFQTFINLTPPVLEQVAPLPGGPVVNNIMSYSGSGDVTADVSTVLPITGCEPGDFAGFPAGDIALISRGACTFAVKATNAFNAGASAVIIYNNVPGVLNGTLGNAFTLDIGVTSVTQEVGQQLAATPGLVMRLMTETFRGMATTSNIFAERTGKNDDNVVVAGAHLDSVDAGPGINDNGSGSAAILEVAEQMAKVKPQNTVRFSWWGAEEAGLVGSTFYVDNLSQAELDEIALYLNFDMVGSPNHVFFIYDGDDSDGEGAGPGPAGSDLIEAKFQGVLRLPRAAFSRGPTSAAGPTTGRSSQSGSPPVGCSPGPKGSRPPMRSPCGVVSPVSSTTSATTRHATPSTTSTWMHWMPTPTPSPSPR